MTNKLTYKGWTIGQRGDEYTASKGGFFTGYYTCSCPGAFADIIDKMDTIAA